MTLQPILDWIAAKIFLSKRVKKAILNKIGTIKNKDLIMRIKIFMNKYVSKRVELLLYKFKICDFTN